MRWRTVQLGDALCDQDQLIINLFGNTPIRYIGNDPEFSRHLHCDLDSKSLVLIINQPLWLSDVLSLCQEHLTSITTNFYIGINRYQILGNDTNISGVDILDCIKQFINGLDFKITQSSNIERDLGRRFNFVQPLTWIYGNQSH